VLLDRVRSDLNEGQRVPQIDRDGALAWLVTARQALEREAEARGSSLREFACTALLAVVGETAAAFVQIGDGAIVVTKDQVREPVFWPAQGEYANTTWFLTDPGFEERVKFRRDDCSVDELAVFTDGLQRVALDYAGRVGYRPFFAPMFRRMHDESDVSTLAEQMRAFLDSPTINGRTDDDKTLILAVRAPTRATPPTL
jgi:hypothetical protein